MKTISKKVLSLVKLVVFLLNAYVNTRLLYNISYFLDDLDLFTDFCLLIAIVLVLISNAVISILIISKGNTRPKTIYTFSLTLSTISILLAICRAIYMCLEYYSNFVGIINYSFPVIFVFILSIAEFIQYNAKEKKPTLNSPLSTGKLDSLVKCKELLDMGVITQEEYDEKKKQLLNK